MAVPIRGDDSGQAPSVRSTASNVVISRFAVILLIALTIAPAGADAARKKGRVTPAGWAVRPAGAEISIQRGSQGFQGPLGSALSPGGQKVLSVSSAATRINSTDLFDLRSRRRIGTVPYDSRRGTGEAVFYGVTWSPGGKRAWASGGGQNVVHVYDIGHGLREIGQIPVPNFPAGLAYGKTPHGNRIYVANNLGGVPGTTNPPGRTVTVIDPKTSRVVKTIDLGLALQPYGVAFGRNGRKVYVTNWMGRSVSVIDTRTATVRRRILLSPPTNPQLADHPNAVAANPRRNEVYTANGNSDTVSVIDTKRDRVTRTMSVGLARGARPGSMPNGLAVAPNGKRLYVALGGENAIAVLDLVHKKRIGFIPAAWNPTDVDITRDGKRIVVISANAASRRPRRCAGPYAVGDCSTGDYAYLPRPPSASRARRAASASCARRAQEAPAQAHPGGAAQQPRAARAIAAKPKALGAIRHVIYVIKENRTYDQVLGNLGKGDGDPSADAVQRRLGAQPPRARPPLHAVRQLLRRRRRVRRRHQLDGVTRASATTSTRRGRSPTRPAPAAGTARATSSTSRSPQQFLTEPLAFDRTIFRGAAALTRGYLWDNAYRHGVSFRNYGMYTRIPGDCGGPGNTSDVTHLDDRRFGDHVDEWYPGFNLECSDHADRYPEWEREFQRLRGAFVGQPRRRPAAGADDPAAAERPHVRHDGRARRSPRAYFADNDLALGRLVEARLAQPVLGQHGDPRHRGRRPERARPRRRPPHARLRDQPVHADRPGRQHPLRHREHGGDGRVAARPAADDDRRPAGDADVEGRSRASRTAPLRRDPADGDPVRGAEGAPTNAPTAPLARRRRGGTSRSRTRRRRSR